MERGNHCRTRDTGSLSGNQHLGQQHSRILKWCYNRKTRAEDETRKGHEGKVCSKTEDSLKT